MLIGGFQHVDLEKAQKQVEEKKLSLRCDLNNAYNRQVLTNCGRTAIIYLLKHCMKLDEDNVLLLPDYLNLSIIVSLLAAHVKYRFYRIKRDLSIDVQDLRDKFDEHVKGIYLIEYFGVPYGQEVVDELKRIRSQWNIPIVEDITQTLLSRDGNRMGFGDYLVCSTRKWMPMTDGGLLAARDGSPFELVKLENGYDEAADKELLVSLIRDYYDAHPDLDTEGYLLLEHDANMTRYRDITVRDMTAFSCNIMFASDTDSMLKQRRANYNYLYERLKNHPEMTIGSQSLDEAGDYVPFGLFLLVEDRDAFKNYMIKKHIIGAVQWTLPLEYYQPGEDAKYLSAHNLMLPCDQCYTEQDMRYVADSVLSFFD